MNDKYRRVSVLKMCAAGIISRHWWEDCGRDNPLYKAFFDAKEMAPLLECVWYY